MQRLTGAFVSALILVSPALAEAADVTEQAVEVNFGDLDVNSDDGARRALYRISRAAREVCDDTTGRLNYEDRAEIRACVRDAMDRAVRDLGSPAVTRRYNGVQQLYARSGARS